MTRDGRPHPRGRYAFGVDIGGSGIKGAPVNLRTGELAAERLRIPTPQPATPDAVASVVAQVVASFGLRKGIPIGVTFPAIVRHGVTESAANVDASWIGTDIEDLLHRATGRRVLAVNDGDAAGYAEVEYGAARDVPGLVVVLTLGTGIGSALVNDGRLVPNSELGHLEVDGFDAESRASDAARDRDGLDYATWATERLQRYFSVVEALFSPDLFVVGGGVSKRHAEFLPLLKLNAPVVPAQLRNNAGIVGAARLAAEAP